MAVVNTRQLIRVLFLSISLFFYGFCTQSKRETKSVLLDQSSCPLSWQPADEFCVRLFFQPASSEDAKQECQLYGAELVNIVKNQQENSALINDLSEIINEPISAGVTELTWLVGGIDAVVNDVQLSYNLWISAKSNDQQEKSLALQLKNNRHFELTTVSAKSAYPFICSLLSLSRKTLLYEQALYPRGSPQIVEQPKLAYHYSPRPEGYFVTIPCKSNGNPVPKIRWFKNGMDEIDVSATNSSFIISGGSLLVPINKNSTESVEYHCTATNIYGTYRSSSTIVRSAFIEPFRATRLDVYANRKTSGTKIECQTPQHYPKSYSFSWMYGGKTNQFITPTERKFISMDGTLFFSYNQKDDATSYACSLSLMSTQSGHYGPFFRLILPEAVPGPSSAPKIDESQPQIFPEIPTFGQSIYIECFAFGFPTPKYKWMRTDGEALSSRHRILNHGRVLKIDNVQVEDANRYKCVATNELGSDSAEIQLVIHSRPTILRPMIEQRAATNTSASFECAVANRNNGHLSIEWFHDGQPIAPLLMPAIDRKRFKIHENILTILNIVETDSGIYQCIASNEVGSVSTSARLTVEDVPPVFHGNIFPRRVFVVEGSNLSLPCLYFASPRGFSQWYTASSDLISMESNARVRQRKNRIVGEESLSILEIENVEKKDEGVYHCETTNGVGEAQGTVEVKVMPKPQLYVRPPSLSNGIPLNTMNNFPAKITCEVELACENYENCPEALFDWQFNDRKIRSLVTKENPLKANAHEREAKNGWKSDNNDKKLKKIRQVSELEITPSFASANIGRFSCNSIYGSGSSELNEPKMINVSPTQLKIIEIRKTQAKLSWKQPANQQRRGFGNNFRMEGYQIEYRTEDDRQWRIFPNGLFKTEDRIVGSYTIRDLVPNQKYQFRIRTRAVDGSLSAPSSHSDWIQTAPSPPLDPIQKLRWKTVDNTHLLLEWDPIEFDHRSGPNLRYNISWSDPTQTMLTTSKNLGDAFSHFELVSEPSFVISLKSEKPKKKKVSKKKKQDDDSCYTIAVGVQPVNDIGTGPSSTDTVVHITSEGPKRYADNLVAIPVNSTHLNLTWEWKNHGECENVLGAQIRCIESQGFLNSRVSVKFAVNHSEDDIVSLISKNSDPIKEDELSSIQVNYSVPAHYSSFLPHNLKAGTEYSCTVQAFDQFGRYGNISTHAASARTFDSAPLSAPEITRIKLHEQESGFITLMEWTAVPLRNNLYNDITNHQRGYKIFIYVSETAENPVVLTLTEAELQNLKTPSARIDGLKLMYFYTVKVAGFNEGGLGPLSKPTSLRLGMSGDINSAFITRTWSIWLFLTTTFAIFL